MSTQLTQSLSNLGTRERVPQSSRRIVPRRGTETETLKGP